MNLKVYVINLDRSPDKMAYMAKQLNALRIPFERIPAVDGRTLTPEKLAEVAVRSRMEEWPALLTPNAIGCALSHYSIYQKMQGNNEEYALILEDDIKIDPDLKQVLMNIENVLNKKDVFLMYFHGDEKSFSSCGSKNIVDQYKLYKALSVWGAYSAGGYIISKEVAKKLARHVFPVHTTADSWGTYHREGVIGDLWAVLPLVAHAANFGSDIGYHKYNGLIRSIEKLPVPFIRSTLRRVRFLFSQSQPKFKIVGTAGA
jgi:glycosyl transferase family 25